MRPGSHCAALGYEVQRKFAKKVRYIPASMLSADIFTSKRSALHVKHICHRVSASAGENQFLRCARSFTKACNGGRMEVNGRDQRPKTTVAAARSVRSVRVGRATVWEVLAFGIYGMG